MVVTFIDPDSQRVSVPGWVTDINAFRNWIDTDDIPEDARVWWLKGEVWIDMSKEQIFTHVLVKSEISRVLGNVATEEELGLFLNDGVLLSNFSADISGNPDGLFLFNDTLDSDRVRLIEGKDGGFVELQGSPDMALEVLSDSSEKKDTEDLKTGYWEAGIREYWLVDARQEPLQFDIFRRGSRGYVAKRKQDGWVKSAVFGRSFRLEARIDRRGYPRYKLLMR